jgi:PAS domain S-box-containing protein
MALLALTLVVALALWVGRIIARSVGEAVRAASALGEGRPLPPGGTPVAEVDTLMEELRESAARRQAAEGLLRDSERRLQLALTAAWLGSWQHDSVRRVLSGDARAKELYDLASNEVSSEELMARVHPEDVDRVWANLDPCNPRRSAVEFRLRRGDGEYRWLEALGLAHFEGRGDERRAVSVVGTVQVITERKELEAERRELAASEARFRATFENAAVGIAHVAPDGKFLRFNKVVSRLLKWPAEELVTKTVWDISHPDDLAPEVAQFKKLEDGTIDSFSMEKRDLRGDGGTIWLRLTLSSVRKSDGSLDYFVGVGRTFPRASMRRSRFIF